MYTESATHHVITHIQEEAGKKGNYIGVFLDNEGPSDITSRDITKAAKWHGL
jgi:hypothetical protein